jgi:hypothetical protein
MNPELKVPGTKLLTLKHESLLSSLAFDFDLRRYSVARSARGAAAAAAAGQVDALFSLFDGVHELCTRLASRGAPGPYETVVRWCRLTPG